MSDDLISRKAVIDYLREQNNNLLMEKQKNGVVSTEACRGMESAVIAFKSFILNLPTVFDKEKTIEELKSAIGDIHYTEDGSFDGKCIEDFEFIQAKTALEIVEKGGVE